MGVSKDILNHDEVKWIFIDVIVGLCNDHVDNIGNNADKSKAKNTSNARQLVDFLL